MDTNWKGYVDNQIFFVPGTRHHGGILRWWKIRVLLLFKIRPADLFRGNEHFIQWKTKKKNCFNFAPKNTSFTLSYFFFPWSHPEKRESGNYNFLFFRKTILFLHSIFQLTAVASKKNPHFQNIRFLLNCLSVNLPQLSQENKFLLFYTTHLHKILVYFWVIVLCAAGFGSHKCSLIN